MSKSVRPMSLRDRKRWRTVQKMWQTQPAQGLCDILWATYGDENYDRMQRQLNTHKPVTVRTNAVGYWWYLSPRLTTKGNRARQRVLRALCAGQLGSAAARR